MIDEHITDMNKQPGKSPPQYRRLTNDSTSDYGAVVPDMRTSYIQGYETEEEEGGKQLTEKEVKSWTPDRVAKHLEALGVEKRHCDVFREQEFSGEVILGMDQSSIFLKELDLGPIGRRLRTWQKIRSIQDEVSPPKPSQTRKISESSQPPSRRASNSSMGVLNRATQLIDRPMSDQFDGVYGQSPGQAGATSPLGLMSRQSPRPSAASVRSIGHSRRQSSIDQTAAPSTSSTPQPPPSSAHKAQSSFDKNWNMTAATGSNPSTRRPSSSHLHSASSDKVYERKESPHLSVATPADHDRGYVSGSEADGGKQRRLLKKRDDHNRGASYESSKRSSFFRRSSRASSPGHSRDISAPVSTVYSDGGVEFGSGAPQIGTLSIEAQGQHPPAVTNLETGVQSNGDGGMQPVKSPRKGLRAISDAVTGKEKALHSMFADTTSSTAEPSVPQTPSSGTPSGPHSMDLGEANTSKFSTPVTTLKTFSGTKRKQKKQTSAYTRGLEQKSPQEQMIGCDYCGWMKKKSPNLMTNWKPRLFVLRGRRLSYYYSENDREEKGLIDISGHRVLPADNERLTGLHATLTKATSSASPTSPQVGKVGNFMAGPTTASPTALEPGELSSAGASSMSPSSMTMNNGLGNGTGSKDDGGFIFKLVPPRAGMSKAVNFTKPTVHYFAVPSLEVGRLWMAALVKATIDRDEGAEVITTYQQKTISLAKARARKERPPALRSVEGEDGAPTVSGTTEGDSILEKVDEASDAEKEAAETDKKEEEEPVQMREVTDLEPLVSKGGMSPIGGHSKKGSRASAGGTKRGNSSDGLGIQGLGNGGTPTSPLMDQMKSAGLW